MKKKIQLALTILFIISECVSIFFMFFFGGEGLMREALGWRSFLYYTNLSNALALFCAIPYLVFKIKEIKNEEEIPNWVKVVLHVGVTATTVTFLTVMFFLGPTIGYDMMFIGKDILLHGVSPVLLLVIYFLEPKKMNWYHLFTGAISVYIYGVLYYIFVVILQTKEDVYGFTKVGNPIIFMIGFFSIATLLSYLLLFLNNKIGGKVNE